MNLNDLVGCSCDIDLQFSCFIEWTIKQSQKTLMGNIRSILSRIFFQFVHDIVCMIITI